MCQKIPMTVFNQKALVRDSDLFNSNFKSHCEIFVHLYATSREVFFEIFICPYLRIVQRK